MKKIFRLLFILVVFLSNIYSNDDNITKAPEYQRLKETLSQHKNCKNDRFTIIAYKTFIQYNTKKNCNVEVTMSVSRSGTITLQGNNLEKTTIEMLKSYQSLEHIQDIKQRMQQYNKGYKKIDKDGYFNCGASDLFSIVGIEHLGRKPEVATPLLNRDKNFDCFGKRLVDRCQKTKFTLLSYMGRELDMHFKIENVVDKCSLVFYIPLPSYKTQQVYNMNNIILGAKRTSLPIDKIMEGKMDDIYEYINSPSSHLNIDASYFEKSIGAKEENYSAFAYYSIYVQPWIYYLSGM